jgi:hypothetical protein
MTLFEKLVGLGEPIDVEAFMCRNDVSEAAKARIEQVGDESEGTEDDRYKSMQTAVLVEAWRLHQQVRGPVDAAKFLSRTDVPDYVKSRVRELLRSGQRASE